MRQDYREALANFSGLISPKTGVIRSVELVKIDENDPQVFLAHATPCDTTALTDIQASNRGAACSVSRERAIIRACGESVERYCSAIFEPQAFRYASATQLRAEGYRTVMAHDVYSFTDAQFASDTFPFSPVAPDQPIRWVEGQALSDHGQAIALAASTVYVPYLFDRKVEPWTHLPISTGLAAGPSLDFCIRKGIYEILERDALMLIWAGRITVPRISPESCYGRREEIDRLLAISTGGKTRWHLSLLTLDVEIPVISAALIDESGPVPKTSFGISSATDPELAVQLAMEEAVLTRTLINRSDEVRAGSLSNGAGASTLRDHMLTHAISWELRARTAFLLDDGPLLTLAQVSERFADATEQNIEAQLTEAGLEAFWTDVTTADVAACNIHVARVVVPHAQPLDNDHRYRFLGGQRLTSVLPRYGVDFSDPGDLNPDPHPFP